MNGKEGPTDLRRVLVALDPGEGGWDTLEAAASLAAGLQAELVGIFVEDSELMYAAALPVTRTISRHAPGETPLDAALMRRALKVSAETASLALAAAAERRKVRWSFRVARGLVVEQVLAEVRRDDLLALGAVGRSLRRAGLTATARAVAERAPCAVLLARGGARGDQPVAVLYDGSERVLELGWRLARAHGRRLLVVALGASEEAAADLEGRAAGWLERHSAVARTRRLVARDAKGVCAGLRDDYPELLVLDRQGDTGRRLAPQAIFDDLGCSLFLLR